MNLTTLLGLGKPLPGENYDIAVPNNNMDLVDAAVAADRARLNYLEGDANKKHHCTVVATSGQSIPDATSTKVIFPATPDSVYGCTWNDANDEITITKAGMYLMLASVHYSANATGPRYCVIEVNTPGGAYSISGNSAGATGGYVGAQAHGIRKLLVGDKVYLTTNQYSGAALFTYHGNNRTQLSVMYVSDAP